MPEDPVEVISLTEYSPSAKILLLRELGYDSDGRFVTRGGERVRDKVTGEEITLDHMAILPGSALVVSDNPLSIADCLEDYAESL